MTWVAWRVQRPVLLAGICAITVLGIWLLATGIAMGHNQTWKYWTIGNTYVLYALPGALGLAIGSPLVASELAQGTNRLAWSQSTTRRHWVSRKLLVGGVLVAVVTALLTLLLEWWTEAVSLSWTTNSGGFSGVRIQPSAFDLTGLVVVGYAVFAFFLGTALGALIRRPGWAFAAGVPIFGFTRLVIQQWVRPDLVTPATLTSLVDFSIARLQSAWVLHEGVLPLGQSVPASGKPWTMTPTPRLASCLDGIKAQAAASWNAAQAHCATVAHVHFVTQFQPASHYWPLQGAETAIFLGMALALFAVTLTCVRRWSD